MPPVENPSEARRRFRPGEPALARFYELKTNRPLYITKGTRVTVADHGVTNMDGYQLSYTDESVITHYGVIISGARLAEIEADYQRLLSADPASIRRPVKLRGLSPWDEAPRRSSTPDVAAIISTIDARGAWLENGNIGKSDRIVSVFAARDMVVTIGGRVMPLKENETLQVFQGTERPRERIIRSETFARNVEALCDFLEKAGR